MTELNGVNPWANGAMKRTQYEQKRAKTDAYFASVRNHPEWRIWYYEIRDAIDGKILKRGHVYAFTSTQVHECVMEKTDRRELSAKCPPTNWRWTIVLDNGRTITTSGDPL